MDTITVQQGQCLIDIALQVYGNADAVLYLMQDNPTIVNLGQVALDPGTQLRVRRDIQTLPLAVPAVVQGYRLLNQRPAKGTVQNRGIGWMQVDTTLTVS
jgi:hypothetical protein